MTQSGQGGAYLLDPSPMTNPNAVNETVFSRRSYPQQLTGGQSVTRTPFLAVIVVGTTGACGQVVVYGHLPERAAPAGEGLLAADGVQPRTLLLPERAEPLRAWHQEQVAEVQRRRQPDHLPREQIAGQREGSQLAACTGRKVFDAYWPDQAILNGSWTPPKVERAEATTGAH